LREQAVFGSIEKPPCGAFMIKDIKEQKTGGLTGEMFKVGAHFGYSRARRHPSTTPFIFTTKNRLDQIDLEKTAEQLAIAKEFVKKLAEANKVLLIVGTKPEAASVVKDNAFKAGLPHQTQRWVGGTLTNFSEIRRRMDTLEELLEKKERGELEKYTKKERLLLDEKIDRLNRFFGTLLMLKRTPDALFIIDSKHEKVAEAEARKMKIPVIALSDTDCDIHAIKYPIVGNDSARSSIEFFVKDILDTYKNSRPVVEKLPEETVKK